VFVNPRAVNCESRQVFKKVLRNGATACSKCKDLGLRKDAQKDRGYSDQPVVAAGRRIASSAKARLEIYADDVRLFARSTSGAIDEDACSICGRAVCP